MIIWQHTIHTLVLGPLNRSYLVSEGDWPKHEDPVVGSIGLAAALEVRLLEGDDLALFGDLLDDDHHPHVRLEKTGFPEVSDSAQLEEVEESNLCWWLKWLRMGLKLRRS